ncbi:unnamed protein product, partial [Durusdinium trenchii]
EAPGGRFLRLPTWLPTQRRTKPGERLRTESAECRQQRGGDASMGIKLKKNLASVTALLRRATGGSPR